MHTGQPTRVTQQLNACSHYNFDVSYNDLSIRAEKISDFLYIRRINQHLKKEMSGHVKSKGVICLSVFLEGTGTIGLDSANTMPIADNTIFITQANFCRFDLPAGSSLNTLELLFDAQLLCQQGFDLSDRQGISPKDYNKGLSVCMSKKISPASMAIINTILNCKANGVGSKLLVQAKALELLSENLLCEQCHKTHLTPHKRTNTKIDQAANFIQTNYQKPLTINLISRTVGLNEKKLKDGFREILETTVHSYIENTRLNIARQRLSEGKKITEVALEIGYSSPSHFAKRFQKIFGENPKSWQMTAFENGPQLSVEMPANRVAV